jgi:Concanavalin A-like lectin/glucanases superfamily
MANDFYSDSNCVALWLFETGDLDYDEIGSNYFVVEFGATADAVNFKEGSSSIHFNQLTWCHIADADLDAGFPLKTGDTTKTGSVCYWMRPEALDDYDSTQFSKLHFFFDPGSISVRFQDEKLTVYWYYDASNHYEGFQHTNSFVVGNFYHIGVVFDGVNKTLKVRVYDVATDTATTCSFTPTNVMQVGNSEWCIGGEQQAYNLFKGNIDEMVVFKNLLSDGQIDSIRLGQFGLGETLTVQDASHSLTNGSIDLTQAHTLVIQDSAHAQTVDNIAVSQYLLTQDSEHGHTSESPTLTENKTLAVQIGAHTLTSDSPALFQAHTLAVQDAEDIHSVDSLLLVQRHRLVVQDVSHGHTAEGDLTLTQVHVPTVQDGIHVFSSDSPALTQAHTLVAQDGISDQTTDTILLNQLHRLAVQDGESAHTTGSPVLTQAQAITVQDGLHAQLADSPVLTQAHVLSASDTAHSLSSDNVTVTRGISLVPADSAHDHTAENVDLEQFRILSVQDGHSSHYVDPIILAQVHSLTVSDSFHVHTADQIIWLESLVEFQSSGEGAFISSSDLDEFQGDKIAEFFSEKVYPDSGTSLAIEEFNA